MPDLTQSQDEYLIRSIDVVHINPSIMEGERFYPGILGPGAAVPIVRYAPTFLVQPSISGSFKIPSVLTCNPGVIDASPQALLYFQWQADGVDIPGETGRTLITSLAFDAVVITCEVDAVNLLGVATGESNGITAELVEPIINHQNDYYAFTGLSQDMQINTMSEKIMVVSGISTEGRIDVEGDVVYMTTGMWVDTRDDVNSYTAYAVQGLNAPAQLKAFENEAYSYWQPTYLTDLAIINPSAETGDLTGWTVTAGTITSESTAQQGTSIPTDGGRYFSGHTSGSGVDAAMNQVVDVDPSHIADIDAGLMFAKFSHMYDTYTNNFGHQVNGSISFLDAGDVVLSSLTLYTYHYQNDPWYMDFSELLVIPANTRKVRLSYNLLTASNRDNRSYLDDVRVQLFKDEHQL